MLISGATSSSNVLTSWTLPWKALSAWGFPVVLSSFHALEYRSAEDKPSVSAQETLHTPTRTHHLLNSHFAVYVADLVSCYHIDHIVTFDSIFVLRKKGSKMKKRMKEEEIEKGDCGRGPPTRKVCFWDFVGLEGGYTTGPSSPDHPHRTILRIVRWCIRLTLLTLVCEVIRYRLVQVRQNLKKRHSIALAKRLKMSCTDTWTNQSSSEFES